MSDTPIPISTLDTVLTAQFAVAWAGESGEKPRLGWWRTDMTSEYGGEDLFKRLLPDTWRWAVLQAAREAARRVDDERRRRFHDPDRLVTLFRFGSKIDVRLDEHLQDLKRAEKPPLEALPRLRELLGAPWRPSTFEAWARANGDVDVTTTPEGRQLAGRAPAGAELCTEKLVAALYPLAPAYPVPHFRNPT